MLFISMNINKYTTSCIFWQCGIHMTWRTYRAHFRQLKQSCKVCICNCTGSRLCEAYVIVVECYTCVVEEKRQNNRICKRNKVMVLFLRLSSHYNAYSCWSESLNCPFHTKCGIDHYYREESRNYLIHSEKKRTKAEEKERKIATQLAQFIEIVRGIELHFIFILLWLLFLAFI